jgi:hypothetical protein
MGGQIPIRVNGVGIFGGTIPAAVWGQYMGAYTQGMPVVGFAPPDSIGSGRFIQADPGFDLTQHTPPPEGGDPNRGGPTTTTQPGQGGGPGPGGGGPGHGGGGGGGPGGRLQIPDPTPPATATPATQPAQGQ